MQTAVPLACFLSMIRPPGVQYENALLQIAPVHKSKCPYVRDGNDIGFQLYTRHNPTVNQDLVLGDDEKLFASNMDFTDPTVIYFHAFMEQPDDGSAVMVREAYMQRGDTNVIMVDAQRLEAGPWYFTAAQNTWYIGRFTGQFVDYLVTRGLNLNNTHFVGHSLGAQAAGVAGAYLTTGRVSRITGLDPALPLFSHLPLEQRLDESDAEFVDVIHTDAGIFGFKAPVGHVDFYPNGGKSPQPGCELEVVIPQQLLLNKCDGTEKTLGFYTYHLTTDQIRNKTNDIDKLDSLNEHAAQTERMAFEKYTNIVKTEITEDSTHHDPVTDFTQAFDTVSKKSINNNADSDKLTDKTNIESPAKELDLISILNAQQALRATNNKLAKTLTEPSLGEVEIDKINLKVALDEFNANPPVKYRANDYVNKILTEASPGDVKIDKGNLKMALEEHNAKSPKKSDYVSKINNDNPDIKDTAKARQTITDEDTLTNTMTQIIKLINTPKLITDRTTMNRLAEIHRKTQRHKRQKRFLDFLKRDNGNNDDNFILKALKYLMNRRNVLPVFSVVREINTLVKSQNGELNHVSKETNNVIGGVAPVFNPLKFTLELGNESRAKAFVKRLLGLTPGGDRLTVEN